MKHEKLDGVEVWKEFEDDLAPRLKLNPIDRTVYAHLLRHTRLEGKRRLRFSIPWLARRVALSNAPVREAMRRLADKGVLRLIERSNIGHLVEVRLPKEVRTARCQTETSGSNKPVSMPNIEQTDFLHKRELRQTIQEREGNRCFYCLRGILGRPRCLDHVVPRAKSGKNTYRNLVACCVQCNWQKKDHIAEDFLRELYREGRLSEKDLSGRLEALRTLVAGKLRPVVAGL